MNRLVRRVAIPGAAAVVIATGGFAFMASNSVASSYAGQGTASISGYNVSHIHYTLKNQGGPVGNDLYVQSVTFTLNHPADANNIAAFIYNTVNTPARYGECVAGPGGTTSHPVFTCSHTGNMQQLTAASKLGVVAAQ